MRIYISVKDRVFGGTNTTHWLHTTHKLRNVGVPRYFFTTAVPESYRETTRHRVRHINDTAYISKTQLGSWDSRNINQRLWMVSEGRPSTVLSMCLEPLPPDKSNVPICKVEVSCQSLLRLGIQTLSVIFARSGSLYWEACTLKVDPP